MTAAIDGATKTTIIKPEASNVVAMTPIMNKSVPWPMRHTATGLQLIMRLKTNTDENSMKCIGTVVKFRATGGYRK